MSNDGLRCSKCPLLDLGVQYPVGDDRDPWRRIEKRGGDHFKLAKKIIGGAMFNHKGKQRLQVEKLLAFYCGRQREAHGQCTNERVRLCLGITRTALVDATHAPTKDKQMGYLLHGLRQAINSDDTHAKMKATRTSTAEPAVTMPPLFKEVPEA